MILPYCGLKWKSYSVFRPLSFEQIEIDTSDYNDKHNFIEKMTAELKKIAFLHLNIAMTFVDLDSPEIVFTCQRFATKISEFYQFHHTGYFLILAVIRWFRKPWIFTI